MVNFAIMKGLLGVWSALFITIHLLWWSSLSTLRQQVLRFLLHYTLLILSSHWKQKFPRALKASHGRCRRPHPPSPPRSLACQLAFLAWIPRNPAIECFWTHWKVALLYNGISQWLSWLPLTPFSRTNGARNFCATTTRRRATEVGCHTFVHTSWSPINYSKAWLLYDLVGGEREINDSLSVCCSRGSSWSWSLNLAGVLHFHKRLPWHLGLRFYFCPLARRSLQ